MASEERSKDRYGRRLSKRKIAPPRASVDIPDRLKDGDDAQEDVTAPKGTKGSAAQYMNQSIFSMITAAGSKADFQSRFDDESSGSEGEGEGGEDRHVHAPVSSPAQESPQGDKSLERRTRKHRRLIPENKLIRSLPKLHLRKAKDKDPADEGDRMSSSQILPPKPSRDETSKPTASGAPVMSRMLEARAEAEAFQREPSISKPGDETIVGTSEVKAPVSLAQRLMEIFEFDAPEEVISGMSVQAAIT